MKIYSNPQQQKAMTLIKDSGLPISDITTQKLKDFLYFGDPDNLIGIIGLEIFDTVALLRSLAVSKEVRGKGHGKTLVYNIEIYAKNKNVKELYLLTETAENFFKKHNYTVIQKDSAPESIKATSEFLSVCPVSAVLMTKKLTEE
jgi:amino-acid N-acetyltransferase